MASNRKIWPGVTRSFNLPSSVDVNTINATYTSGVSEIVIAKNDAAKPKQIPVKVCAEGIDGFGFSLVQ